MYEKMDKERFDESEQWFILRDLKRPNSKSPAYKQLVDEQYKVFTPLKWRLRISKDGKRIREKVPFIQDFLFVYGKKSEIDQIVQRIPTLQFRFRKGGYCIPMVVSDAEMEEFMYAVKSSNQEHSFQEKLPRKLLNGQYV